MSGKWQNRPVDYNKKWQNEKYRTDPVYRQERIARSKAYYEAHKDEPEFKARKRAYYLKNQERTHAQNKEGRRRRWLKEFGLTEWGRECEICGGHDELSRDHDHATGQWRGWLCRSCNVGLGYFRDDPERLEKAAEYLRCSIRLGVR